MKIIQQFLSLLLGEYLRLKILPTAIAAGASIAGGLLSGSSSRKAAKQQAEASRQVAEINAQSQRDTNEFNKRMVEEARAIGFGGQQDAAIRDFGDFFNATRIDQGDRLNQFRNITNSMKPIVAGGNRTLADIFSGNQLESDLNNLQNVFTQRQEASQNATNRGQVSLDAIKSARTNRSRGIAESARQGLQNAIAQLNAAQTRKGFLGGSSFANKGAANAFINAQTRAGLALSDADLENAISQGVFDEQNIGRDLALVNTNLDRQLGLRDTDLNRRIQLLDAPFRRTQQLLQLETLPEDALSQAFIRRLDPLSRFRVGETFQATTPQLNFNPPAIPGSGQIIGSAISQGAQTLGNHFANQQILEALNNSNNTSLS